MLANDKGFCFSNRSNVLRIKISSTNLEIFEHFWIDFITNSVVKQYLLGVAFKVLER